MRLFKGLFQKVTDVITRRPQIDEDLYDALEESLIEADVGVETATELVERLRRAQRKERLATPDELTAWLKSDISRLLMEGDRPLNLAGEKPSLLLIVGVNGSGKTTSCARLARLLQREGRKPMLAAADTFRAAAIDQLALWSERLGFEMVRHREGADPAAVVYDAVVAAKARGHDVVIADTAGRLHTRANLMEELKKIGRVAERAHGRPPDEVLLVLDATIGQNSISQARAFSEALGVTAIILTKLDGTARGGVILAIKNELKLPILFAGTGEGADDLSRFNPREFASALFSDD